MYYDHDHQAPTQNDPCEYLISRYDALAADTTGNRRSMQPCGAPWYSVLHRPNQYRHWCEICEQGGDHD